MEYLILAIVIIVLVLMLKFIFKFNIKEIKEIGVNKKLDELTKKFPENTEICKWYLKKLNKNTRKFRKQKFNVYCNYRQNYNCKYKRKLYKNTNNCT